MVLPDMDSAQFCSMRETAQRCLNSSLFSLSTLGGNTISLCVFMAGLGPSVMLCLWTNSLHFILSQICMVKSLGLSNSEEIQICSLVRDFQYSHVTDVLQRHHPQALETEYAEAEGFTSLGRQVTGPGLNESVSGCLAISPDKRNPFYNVLGQALSYDVYRSVTLALNQMGTHLTEEAQGEEKTGGRPRGSLQARQDDAGRKFTAGVTRRDGCADKTER